MIKLQLTDSIDTLVLPLLEVPLSENTIENATDVETLDKNIYTDFISLKRLWNHTWAYLSETEYNALKAFYDRQFTVYQYPLLTIDYYSISGVPVRMTLQPKNIINNCGMVQDVTIGLRETSQLSGSS